MDSRTTQAPTMLPLSQLHGLDPEAFGPLLARLLAIADDAVVIADESQRVVLFNEGAERIFGYASSAVLGQPLDLLLPESARGVHGDHVRRFAGAERAARRMGERAEIHGRRADGSLFDAEASISHVALHGRAFFTAILRDVSVRKHAERALMQSEARFRSLAESAPVGIFQVDRDGAFRYVNDRWCEIAGLSPAEAQGAGWTRVLHPEDRERMLQAWQHCQAAGVPFSLEYRLLRPDGRECWVMGNAVASPDADGASGGRIGTLADVTEARRQATELERAKSEAEAAARAKSLFLANMSHEIRTPLNAVIGMTTLLLDTPMSDDQRDFARTIRASGENLLEVINDILDYSKADIGKLELENQVFDLRRLIEDSLDLVTPRALEKGLNLACMVDENAPEALVGDATRVRQILVNLLSNAVKFTHHGEVLVTADGEALGEGLWRIHLAVKDTGIGIAREHLARLFQSFTQVDASTTRKYGGTGLGLAISKRLAELMGGAVWVESEHGQGSVFHVTLTARAAAVSEAQFLQRNSPLLAGKRVLIVDDNLTNRRILTKQALLWGMLPTTLPSPLEALDLIRHGERFDVAVLDMSMPDMDGSDLAAEIRRYREVTELPIVVLTSLGQRFGVDEEGQPGFSAYLAKPIKASQLFATLVGVLGGAEAADPQAVREARTEAAQHAALLPLRVLVAEDNPVNQKVAMRILQRLGYRPDLVANGLEVLDAVERQDYDVVLMDIQMPEMDGVEAARWIVQRRGKSGRPRIIAMTANAMPGDRESYLAAGMDGYVAKPIDMGELAAVLSQLAVTKPMDGESSDAGVLDLERLEHLRGLQDDTQPYLVRELIDMFVADASSHVDAMVAALAAGDAAQLRSSAHRFLSVTENIGAPRMSGLCREIERLAKAQRLQPAGPLIEELAQERVRAQEALLTERLRY